MKYGICKIALVYVQDNFRIWEALYRATMIETTEAMALLIGRSENTKRNYRSGLRMYCEFRNLRPNELVDEIARSTEKSSREQERVYMEVKKYYDWLREEKKLSTGSAHICITAVRAFYRDNGFPLKPLRLPSSRVKKENIRRVLRPEEVNTMVDCCKNLRDRAIVLIMFQGGFDTQTLLSLDYGDVKKGLVEGEEPLVIHVVRQKEGVDYKTCIGHDAIEALKLYLHERELGPRYIPPEKLKPDSPLFISERVYDKKKHRRLTNVGVGIVFRDLARRSGVVDVEDLKRSDINIVGAHALRKSFSTICRNSGVPPDLVEYMIGHRLKFGGAYYEPSDEKLKEKYRKVEPFLSISDMSVKIENVSSVKKMVMLREIAEVFGIKSDYLLDKYVEEHTLSGEEDILSDPELLKGLIGALRDEINTKTEMLTIRVLQEWGINMDSVYKCLNCGIDLKKNWEICPKCGKEIGFTTCDKCGETLSCDWKYCPKCSKKL